MPTGIRIIAGNVSLSGELFDSPCGRQIADLLPIEERPSEWGDEFYFQIPRSMALDSSATVAVKAGDIGYWPPGNAVAIFFGPTPMSISSDPVPASEVNIIGRITGDATALRKAKGTHKIRLELI